MGKFQSELHILCEEARWPEVCSILKSILESERLADEAGEGSSDGHYDHSGVDVSYEQQRHQQQQHPSRSHRTRYGTKKLQQSSSSIAPTSTNTSEPATVYDDDASSTEDSYEGSLRCSYEKLLHFEKSKKTQEEEEEEEEEEHHHRNHDVTTILESSNHSLGEEDVATSTEQPPERRPSISSTENNVEKLPTPSPSDAFSPEQIQSYKQQLVSREGANQWTPLMVACVQAPPVVLSLLTRVCPQACRIPDRSGSLPLHFVSCWRRSKMMEMDDELLKEALQNNKGKRDVLESDNNELHSSETSRESREQMQQKKRSLEDELCLVFYILMTAYPDSVATINRWSQTPIHSLFESKPTPIIMQEYSTEGDLTGNRLCSVEFLLGLWDERICDKFNSYSFVQEPDGFSSIMQALQSAVQRALRTRDNKGRLPLHSAAGSQWVDESMLRAVVAAYRPATWIPVIPPNHAQGGSATRSSASWDITRNAVIPEDVIYQNEEAGTDGLFPKTGGCYGKDLAVHVLHRRLMLPLSTNENSADDDLSHASVYFNEKHCGAISALLEPLVNAASDDFEAKLACAATGSGINPEKAEDGLYSLLHSHYGDTSCALLPLHIAAIHGVSYDILEGLLRAHPEGARTPMASSDRNGDRRRYGALAIELFEEGRSGLEVNVASDTMFPSLMQSYFRRSDLLFSYFPEAVSTKNVAYCKDKTRLRRFEKLIRREASRLGEKELFSDEACSLWLFLCRNSGSRKSRIPNYSAMVGRILDGLDSQSVRKLSVLRTRSSPEGVRVPTLPNGRSIIEEAKERAPSGSMIQMMAENFFQSEMLSYLPPEDALSWSTSCRSALAGGVRLLQETSDEHGSMTWELTPLFEDETDSERHERGLRVSQPWKELSLPYVPSSTHSVLVRFEVDYHSLDGNVNEEDEGGGLIVLCDDPATNTQGMLVAASIPVRAFEAVAAQVSFSHVPGRKYTLWNYGSEEHILQISNLTTRQLVYSKDYNGHNPLHVLLGEGDNPQNLKNQIKVLINAGFGCSKGLKASGNLPLLYALKVGASQQILKMLIDAQPAALLYTNNEKMTPLHVALNCHKMPSIGLVEALLTHSGINACHLKDSSGRLPLHIAAENGASETLLRLLVDAYPDGCYRRTDVGDLPLHLLVRSGAANQSSVELLLRPIMDSNTICTYGGNKELGLNLPLHIAAAYNCSFDILQNLLSSYGEAASIRRQILKSGTKNQEKHKSSPEFALAILEEMRGKIKSDGVKDKVLKEADFNRRSDLIFAYFANAPKTELPYLPTYYRDEKDRRERLKTLIRKEALNCTAMVGTGDVASSVSDMARLAWCWMCTSDEFAGLVADILKGLPIDVVNFLITLENPNSEPTPNIPIMDCSAPKCAVVMKSRVSFLGRYSFDPMEPPLHKTETSIVLKAKDIGAMEKYLHIQTILSDSDPDIDDYSHSCGSMQGIKARAIEVNTFTRFCEKIGLDKSRSTGEAEALLRDFYEKDDLSVMSQDEGSEINLDRIGVKKIVFDEFCKMHGIDSTGCRMVAIKFMKSRKSFELELQCREILRGNGNIVHVLNDFSLESGNDDNSPSMIYGYRYGIVMPCADRDLGDILYREGINSANLRCSARQIGETIKSLHEQGISYLDLQLKNVLQFGKQMMLSDFGSTLFLKSILDVNAIGGSSSTICPSVLPPELVAKIDLSTDGFKFDLFRSYWKHVSDDAESIRVLTPHERQLISKIIVSHKGGQNSMRQSWRDEISSSLETIEFRDLPQVLSSCGSVHNFSVIWERMCANNRLWDIVRPRVDMTNQCAYMLKTFEDRDDSQMLHDVSDLPYKLIHPSEKVDVWAFGIFIYQLCGGGNPFHTGYQGNLLGVDAYSRLHHWSKVDADKSISEHIQDPLAQDLLRQILIPASERLPNMTAVLRHPFFSPTSTEAERYLEKHEEMQLLRENTVVVGKVTGATSRMLEDSMEKYSRIAFSTDRIAFPTCFVVLPYDLQLDESQNRYCAMPSKEYASCAERLGKCLLEINKATARMSFWIRMNDKIRDPRNGDNFKSQMQEWIIRARQPDNLNAIAKEIVKSLGLGPNYNLLCEEILAFDGSISKAKSYMKNPLRAARRAIGQNADSLADLFSLDGSLSLYLIDEDTMMPAYVDERHSPYPLRIHFDKSLFKNALLPFINIAVMKALARGRFHGLASLLGFPPSFIIPDSWKASEPGLLHSTENSDSIEEFVLLQKVVRKDDLQSLWDDASVNSSYSGSRSTATYSDIHSFSNLSLRSSASIDLSEGDPVIASVPMIHLELLFREFDPDRHFNNLRRVSRNSEESSPGLWTVNETVNDLQEAMELADIENQLQELALDYEKKKNTEIEIRNLLERKKAVKVQLHRQGFPFHKEIFYSRESIDTEYEALLPGDVDTKKSNPGAREPQADPKPTGQLLQDDGTKIPTYRMRNNDPDLPTDEGGEKKKSKKMRKSKRKFRPWFGAC